MFIYIAIFLGVIHCFRCVVACLLTWPVRENFFCLTFAVNRYPGTWYFTVYQANFDVKCRLATYMHSSSYFFFIRVRLCSFDSKMTEFELLHIGVLDF